MEEMLSRPFLTTMVGKEVRAYKGGPESWHGLLLAVQPDYILLFNEKEGYIYYKTQHIKSVIVDSKSQKDTTSQSDGSATDLGSFHDLLMKLTNQEVKINRGGPSSKAGTLLTVTDEYLALETKKDGVIYFNLEHIKSITVKHINNQENEIELNDEERMEIEETETDENILYPFEEESESDDEEDIEEELQNQKTNFIEAESLDELFNQMKYSFVMINYGPESVEGVLCDSSNNLLTLVFREEVLRVSKFHVKTIRQKSKGTENENNNQNSKQNNSDSILVAKKQRQNRKKKR